MKSVSDLSITSAPLRPRRGWHPGWLFRAGAQGAWFDPSDLTTLFQDSAGTVPVTSDGDPVGLMLDKSGNGHHAAQATAAARPIWRSAGGYPKLEFNGINTFMVTSSVTPGAHKVQLFAGVNKRGTSGAHLVVEHSPNLNENNGTVYLFAPLPSGPLRSYGATSRGTSFGIAFMAGDSHPSPSTNVATVLADIAGDSTILRIDGVQVAQATTDQGSGAYTSQPMYLGMRGGVMQPLLGGIHGLVIRFGPLLSDTNIANAERYIARKSGVSL